MDNSEKKNVEEKLNEDKQENVNVESDNGKGQEDEISKLKKKLQKRTISTLDCTQNLIITVVELAKNIQIYYSPLPKKL